MNDLHAADIREFAASVGIFPIGFAKPLPGAEAEKLKAWLKKGCHAGMGYIEKDAAIRTFEQTLLNGQKSLVIGLFPYPALLESSHISSYALFPDYHTFLNKKLLELKKFVEAKVPGVGARVFADTSPVMEKPLAVRAGLGFQGRNTLLVNPEYGSYCFIGGLILDCDIAGQEAPPAAPDECGDCRLCLDACPTRALSDNGLDARRCLSYHNVENRGDMP
jgi:epoxyqueuosine reductase